MNALFLKLALLSLTIAYGASAQEMVETDHLAKICASRADGGEAAAACDSVTKVFKLNEDGNAYSVLHRFRADGIDDGRDPAAGLIQASDGALYGTTTLGGSDDAGTIFKLNGDGGGYALVYSFRTAANDPQQPSGSLVESSDGSLYGVTTAGGMYNAGTVFKLNKDGSGFAVVRSFSDRVADGTTPIAALTRASDGALYGTASKGGDFSSGIVFKLFSGMPQITITHVKVGTAGAMLQLSGGAAGQSCEIEARPTLDVGAQWQVLGSSTGDIDGHFEFLDPDASHYPGRFYRSASH